uniref:MH1 domain-containing protein n=1 Tax=Ditylenchus dipsaci TaxID=166011 RepID=A0A915EGT1_9BILA
MWRWKDLQVDAALHRLDPLPWCRFGRVTINNATVSCCNPYHYGLWIRPEHSSGSEEQSVSGHILCAEHTVTNDTGYSADETGGIGHVRHSIFRTADLLLTGGENNNDVLPDLPPPPVPTTYDLNIASPSVYTTPNHLPPSIHTQAIAWGRMARWERKERIGEVVALVGQFVAIGKLAGTRTRCLLRSSGRPRATTQKIYGCIIVATNPVFMHLKDPEQCQVGHHSTPIPGYCIRVHRTPSNTATEHTSAATAAAAELIHTAALAGRHSIQLADPLLMNTVSFLTISVGTGWGSTTSDFM